MNLTEQLSPHFNLREFLHPGAEETLNAGIVNNLRRLALKLEEVRALMGNKPITITSGYRSPAHNKAVGGASKSQHLYGTAADIVVKGLTPKEVQAALKDWAGGLGSYATFSHLDIGPKRRWNG